LHAPYNKFFGVSLLKLRSLKAAATTCTQAKACGYIYNLGRFTHPMSAWRESYSRLKEIRVNANFTTIPHRKSKKNAGGYN
jgi:hypothetical protein